MERNSLPTPTKPDRNCCRRQQTGPAVRSTLGHAAATPSSTKAGQPDRHQGRRSRRRGDRAELKTPTRTWRPARQGGRQQDLDVAATAHHGHRPRQYIYREAEAIAPARPMALPAHPKASIGSLTNSRSRPRRSTRRHQGDHRGRHDRGQQRFGDRKKLAEAMKLVGATNGVITIEEGKTATTEVVVSRACSSTALHVAALRHQPGGVKSSWTTRTSLSSRRRSATPRTSSRCWSRSPRRRSPLLIIAEDIEGEAWRPWC